MRRLLLVLLSLLPLNLYAQGATSPPFRGSATWNLIWPSDNTFDIGASGATRPRTGYFGTSVITPALTVSGLTSGRVTFASTGGLLADDADLTFATDTLTATKGVFSSALTIPAGTTAATGTLLGNDTDTWIGSAAVGSISFYTNNTERHRIADTGNFTVTGSFLMGAAVTSADVSIRREGAASIQFGADAGSPTAQTLKSCDGSGTDIAGCNYTLAAGNPTGTGAGGDMRLQTAVSAASTGSSQQTPGDRIYLRAKCKALTESSATAIAQVSVASGASTGGELNYTVRASDGTDHQSRHARINWSAVNKAGTETCVLAPGTVDQTTDGNAGAISSGTLTYAVTCTTTPTNGIQFEVNAVSSLTQTVLEGCWSIGIDGAGTVSPQ